MANKDTWYVAIKEYYGLFSSFIAAGGDGYRNYKGIAEKCGFKILAEEFGISDNTINRLTGFDENGKRTQRKFLAELVFRLEKGEKFDVQKELSALCASVE